MAVKSNSNGSKYKEAPWWKDGIRFQCQGSGKCCTSHGEYGFVFLTLKDRQRLAKHLGMKTDEFTRKHCQRGQGVWHLTEESGRPDCQFLKNKGCSVYEARPTQCRTWPFWPEVMNAKSWQKDVVSFCPGVNKGPIVPKEEIEKILFEQSQSESQYGN